MRNRMQTTLWGVKVMMMVLDLSEKQTAGPLIYHNTSLQLHLHNQSHPLLIDVWIIELSPGFSCFSSPPAPDFRNCIVFYFKSIYNKRHPDVHVCQYSARRLSGRQSDANSCTRHDRLLACPG